MGAPGISFFSPCDISQPCVQAIDRLTTRPKTHQLLKHALVERFLDLATLPELLIVVVEAQPVLPELLQTVLVHIVQTVRTGQRIGSP